MSGSRAAAALLLLSISLVESGCGLGEFDVQRQIPEQRVAGSALGGLLDGFLEVPIPLDVDVEAEVAARDAGPAQAVRLSRLDFSVTAGAMTPPDEDDFAFLRSATVYVESERDGSELPRVMVAQLPGPGAGRNLEFATETSVDLLPYVEEGARFVSEANANVPPDDVTFNGRFRITIEVF